MYLLTDSGALINMERVNAIEIRKVEIEEDVRYSVVALFDATELCILMSGLTAQKARAAITEIAQSYINSTEKTVIDFFSWRFGRSWWEGTKGE